MISSKDHQLIIDNELITALENCCLLEKETNVNNIEKTFMTNYLSHFFITYSLRKSSRACSADKVCRWSGELNLKKWLQEPRLLLKTENLSKISVVFSAKLLRQRRLIFFISSYYTKWIRLGKL